TRREKRHGGEHTGEKALHVARAAAVKLAVSELELEGIARPSLALDRNAVAVAGQTDAAAARSDARKQASLCAIRRRNQRRADTIAVEIGLDERDELQIGFSARRIEGDELRQQLLHFR